VADCEADVRPDRRWGFSTERLAKWGRACYGMAQSHALALAKTSGVHHEVYSDRRVFEEWGLTASAGWLGPARASGSFGLESQLWFNSSLVPTKKSS
jgi:hypothetical protein